MKMTNYFVLALMALQLNSFAEFKSEDEATIISTSGNSDFKTYALKSDNSYSLNSNTIGLKGKYTYGESDKVRNAENWEAQLSFGHALNDSISLIAAEIVEANRFAGFSRRYNTDLGLKYSFLKSDTSTALMSVSYRYSVEKNVDENIADKKDSKAKIYFEGSKQINKAVFAKLWTEYIPNFSESEDYQINFEPSISVVMSDLLSLKMAYLWNYDHAPSAGSQAHDTKYTTSVIAKF